MNKSGRVYVCHTYYHVFVTCLKELNLKDRSEPADLVLSTMSTDFEDFPKRFEESGIFRSVIMFDEKRESNFPELDHLRDDKGNIISNMYNRIRFTKKFAKCQEPYIPVDFRQYREIYVFCDTDPIGYYLNRNHIYYHAVEDGYNTLRPCVYSRFDNQGHWKLKKFFSKKLNLIFIRDGYGKYCLDMEVNDISVIKDDPDVYKEVPRNALMESLDKESRELIIRTFVRGYDKMTEVGRSIEGDRKNILILTEPLTPSFDTRERIFRDLVDEYSKEGRVFIKPHPRDDLDYRSRFADVLQFDRTIPMEIFNFFEEIHFDLLVAVYTELGSVKFADRAIQLGHDFMDRYEDPAIHRKSVT
ncbi:MAG: glycosyltransferase family 52 protein [Lachnospiraceae bacterium]|nr:glycosyltransferase family 52 protein [Lachnospiraceae bacterium]